MPLKNRNKLVIMLGDTTDHKGEVISVRATATDMGRPIACVGDLVKCDKCNGTYKIIEGDPYARIDGIPIAFEGHKTECGAILVSSVKPS